jgi:hypothetical protein
MDGPLSCSESPEELREEAKTGDNHQGDLSQANKGCILAFHFVFRKLLIVIDLKSQ